MPSEPLPPPHPEPDDLASLVGSRLCHDLISPLGAIGNGVELLAMTMRTSSAELQLIAESVAAANARVKFFRFAFGRAGEQRVGRPEMAGLMNQYSACSRIAVDWQVDEDHSRDHVRLVCLAVLCLEPAMPRGGKITVTCDSTAGLTVWTIRGITARTKPDPELWATLDGQPRALAPSEVQFGLLARDAPALGRRVRWSITEGEAVISL